MTVRVRLFAILADIAGSHEVEVTLGERARAADLLDALAERFPKIQGLRSSLRVAVNQEYVEPDHPIGPDDEVALIPPVSGGEGDRPSVPFIEVTDRPLSADRYHDIVVAPSCGAVALFSGVVREFTGKKRTVYLRYEAYGAMAVREMRKIAAEIEAGWPGARVAIAHRVGELRIGECSVIVAVATPHRREAFEAAQYGIDTLKERVPIWKKEIWDDGESWVGIHA